MPRDPEKVRRYARETRERRIQRIGRTAESRRQRGVYLKHAYGLSLAGYEQTLREQGGCAICRRTPHAKNALHVDHNHETEAVRGVLCARCNIVVGFVEKTPGLIADVLSYLDKYAGVV